MKHYKTLALTTAAALGLMISTAHAQGAPFTSHHLVPYEDYAAQAAQLSGSEKLELRQYLNYEDREPCQGYRVPPQPFVHDRCHYIVKEEVVKTVQTRRVETTRRVEPARTRELRPVIADYTIYFDFDRSNIRASEQSTLETVAREIRQYEPYEVTVVGHTDRSGPSAYNDRLSQRRAQAVSDALHNRGIPNRIIDQEAMGENDPAVPTADGVKLQENRRVEIQFRK